MSKDYQFSIRLPADLKNTIQNQATINGRSLNRQIVFMLGRHIEMQQQLDQEVVEKLMQRVNTSH